MTTTSNISVSIDDGHPLDIKAAEILGKKNIHTTFYIPIKNSTGRPTLNRKQIKWLSEQPNFEIGGHTYNHIDLTKVSLDVAEEEMRSGKEALEDIIGKPVTTFAWPWGKYSKNLVFLAKKVGFLDSRIAITINFNRVNKTKFLWTPNLQLKPHTCIQGVKNCLKRFDFYSASCRIFFYHIPHLKLITPIYSLKEKCHIWFHSWEIAELNMWDQVECL